MADIRIGAPAPVEYPITVYINDREYLTLQATPDDLEDLALGLLFTAGLITGGNPLPRVTVDADHGLVWADLGSAYEPTAMAPEAEALSPVPPGVRVRPDETAVYLGAMLRGATRYHLTRGCHSAMAVRPATGERLIREDIGRHNAVDKVIGAALRQGWTGSELVVCTSGRISHEMCTKLARFGVGVAASRTAATDLAVDLADRLGMDLLGYVRTASRYTLYTIGQRLIRD